MRPTIWSSSPTMRLKDRSDPLAGTPAHRSPVRRCTHCWLVPHGVTNIFSSPGPPPSLVDTGEATGHHITRGAWWGLDPAQFAKMTKRWVGKDMLAPPYLLAHHFRMWTNALPTGERLSKLKGALCPASPTLVTSVVLTALLAIWTRHVIFCLGLALLLVRLGSVSSGPLP